MAIADIGKFIRQAVKHIEDVFISDSEERYVKQRSEAKQWLISIVDNFKEQDDKNALDTKIFWAGTFYVFQYYPKLYEQGKLQWYDAFPLILVLDNDRNGFLGINFHYILPQYRMMVIRKLMLTYPKKFIENKPMLPMNYNLFKQKNKNIWRWIEPAIKRYLWKQILGYRGLKVLRVNNDQIVNSIFYTTPEWVGTSESKVFTEIKRKAV